MVLGCGASDRVLGFLTLAVQAGQVAGPPPRAELLAQTAVSTPKPGTLRTFRCQRQSLQGRVKGARVCRQCAAGVAPLWPRRR